MNWEIFGATMEMLGALTVLVTLIYLAIQLKQSNAFAQAQAMQARTDTQINMISFLMSDPNYLQAISTVITAINAGDAKQISEEDKRNSITVLSVVRATLENTYEQYKKGLIRKDFYQGVTVQTIKTYGAAMLALDLWLSPDFKKEVIEILEAS